MKCRQDPLYIYKCVHICIYMFIYISHYLVFFKMCNYLQTRVRSAVDRLLVPAVQAGGQDRQPRETALRPWSHLIQGLLEGRYIYLYISSRLEEW